MQKTPLEELYAEDLAYIHHVGFPDMIDGASAPLLQEFADRGIHDGLIVDLGCGGGGWSRRLTDAGYQAWGCDISPSMIALARATAPAAQFEVASLFDAELPPCRAVTALGEGFNYGMSGTDPAATMRDALMRIADALPPGGLFVFDLVIRDADAPMAYRNWKIGEDWAILIEVHEDLKAHSLSRDATLFREVDGHYRRSQECHVIGVPAAEDVLQQLDQAGFDAEVRDGYGNFKVLNRRAAFYATRRP
ncbi:MAG: class I SAM-dependent methyltransferase [Planctomycetota bacterium]